MNGKTNLASPWQLYRQKLAALFMLDESVVVGNVVNTDSGPTITVKVNSHTKAAALRKVLKSVVEFSNVTLNIVIEDTAAEETITDTIKTAFAYNRLVRGVEVNTDPTGADWTYIVMEPDVLQFPADNLADYRGNISLLAEDVAREVLTDLGAGTAVCTAALNEN